MNFNQYLKTLQHSKKSIISCEKSVNRFLEWLKEQCIEPEQTSYGDILAYMKHCQQSGATQRTVQNYLNMIRHFYDHLIEQRQMVTNPVASIKVQGVKRKTLYHIFKPEELDTIYYSYQDETLKGKRNKIMLSLLVYQGVKTDELAKLEVQDVKLREGKIHIPGGLKSEGRILQLEPHQVLEFHDYVSNTRKEILAKSEQLTDKLFVSIEGGDSFNSCMNRLMYWVKRRNKLVINPKQLRASVIVKWLRMYNLRRVQYLAGHRYISSTEAYQQSEMDGLTEEVNQFHPLG
ncbi:site-specific tyrosine recombinase XerD [Cytophagales bacterium WSM2-2]|nr:site-specific tyrosine recombinase XerD [Cytophagales bacterium WSM2-2]